MNRRDASAPGSATAADDRLIACSPDRTLVMRRDDGGRAVLVKIYERGSASEAEREARLAALAGGEGVVRCRGAARDPSTGRPCVVFDHRPGLTIGQWLSRQGPMPPITAARIFSSLATTLARLHGLRSRDLASGLVHRDIKPGNVLLAGDDGDPGGAEVVLLDFEHATPTVPHGRTVGAGFTGATHGFAPPEAYAGAPPNPAFDVFGFGATLHAALVGRPAFAGRDTAAIATAVLDHRRSRQWLDGAPLELVALIDDCLAADPEARPTTASVAATLQAFVAHHDGSDPLDEGFAALLRGDLSAVAGATETHLEGDAEIRRRALRRKLRRRGRLLARMPHAPRLTLPDEPIAIARNLVGAAPRLLAWLDRFPADADGLAEGRRLAREMRRLLVVAPQKVRELERGARFGDAQELLLATRTAARATERLTADTPPSDPAAARVSPMERDPQRYLDLALRDVAEAAQAYEALVEALRGAESDLDMPAAQRVLESAASLYSGATTAVAALKDRAHRFRFYLERIGQPVPEMEVVQTHLAASAPELDLEPLRRFQERCAAVVGTRDGEDRERVQSVRGLRRAVDDLLAEFPHTRVSAEQASRVLTEICEALTDRCWTLLEEGRRKLAAVPIPIRPLQSVVLQIDALRRMEVLVDRPGRPRSALLDELERLRLKTDQARTTRDRIARGAQEALDRGHLTTALFDMERAVDQLSDETGELEPEGQKLVARLQEAKRRKESVDQAAAHNVELGARYVALQDDPYSDPDARIAVLDERRQVLLFLVHNLQGERVERYEHDLREVETSLVLERSERGERRLDIAATPVERERVVRATIGEIGAMLRTGRGPTPGRIRRVLERWEDLGARARDEAQMLAAERRRTQRQRRRRQLAGIGVVALAVLLGLATFQLGRSARGDDGAAGLAHALEQAAPPPLSKHVDAARPHVDAVSACVALEQFVQVLETHGGPALGDTPRQARVLVDEVRTAADGGADFRVGPWADRFQEDLRRYAAGVRALSAEDAGDEVRQRVVDALFGFGTQARDTGVALAAVAAGEHERLRAVLHETAELDDPGLDDDVLKTLLR